jgi:hypothetical protein
MAVPAINLTIPQGTDFESTFTVTNPDGSVTSLAGYSAAAKIKKFPDSAQSYPFSVSITAATGTVTVSMANTITSSIDSGRYYYDVVITNSSNNKKTRVVEGMALVTAAIT